MAVQEEQTIDEGMMEKVRQFAIKKGVPLAVAMQMMGIGKAAMAGEKGTDAPSKKAPVAQMSAAEAAMHLPTFVDEVGGGELGFIDTLRGKGFSLNQARDALKVYSKVKGGWQLSQKLIKFQNAQKKKMKTGTSSVTPGKKGKWVSGGSGGPGTIRNLMTPKGMKQEGNQNMKQEKLTREQLEKLILEEVQKFEEENELEEGWFDRLMAKGRGFTGKAGAMGRNVKKGMGAMGDIVKGTPGTLGDLEDAESVAAGKKRASLVWGHGKKMNKSIEALRKQFKDLYEDMVKVGVDPAEHKDNMQKIIDGFKQLRGGLNGIVHGAGKGLGKTGAGDVSKGKKDVRGRHTGTTDIGKARKTRQEEEE